MAEQAKMPDGATSIRLGAAVLRPMTEKGLYGLYRPIVFVRRDGAQITREQHTNELGPLAVYRAMGPGDKAPEQVGSLPSTLKTHDPISNRPLTVMLVWRPTREEMQEEFKDG